MPRRSLDDGLKLRGLYQVPPDFTDWLTECYPDLDPEDDAGYWEVRQEYIESYGEENL